MAIKHVVTFGFGFADTAFIPPLGFSLSSPSTGVRYRTRAPREADTYRIEADPTADSLRTRPPEFANETV